MSKWMALFVLIAATAFIGLAAPSLAGVGDDKGGINPVHHPEIFGNPAVAASYGFVRSRDGTWHVAPNCRR